MATPLAVRQPAVRRWAQQPTTPLQRPLLPQPGQLQRRPAPQSREREATARTHHRPSPLTATTHHKAAALRGERLNALLKSRRLQLGLRQVDIAVRLDISPRAYGTWERGRVKEWTDHKLHALSEALEMTAHQEQRLFRLAVNRDPQQALRSLAGHVMPDDPETQAFLHDYATMMDAVAFPSFLINHRWDVKMANPAYRALFDSIRQHPTAMPERNFLRFVLFHPDAPSVLADHKNSWLLPMLAQLSSALEVHDQDRALHAIRREVALRPDLHNLYLYALPSWVLSSGADVLQQHGATRALHHPNPQLSQTGCRLVGETPRHLQAMGYTRITMVPTAPAGDSIRGVPPQTQRTTHDHNAQ
ncbi:helix-turn-helix domain-containing protein [Streptomyces sp. NPDC004647]|uniref:MmyB family transcriptional regulator n=1 Tax=Streptomyces sp. NPDC004647 TaxID=3154671 RepID=UPI0033B582E8